MTKLVKMWWSGQTCGAKQSHVYNKVRLIQLVSLIIITLFSVKWVSISGLVTEEIMDPPLK